MHGVVFTSLKQFTEQRLGKPQWYGLLQEAGLGYRLYLTSSDYPEDEAFALLELFSARLGIPASQLQEQFGQFLAGEVLRLYRSQIQMEWRTLALLMNAQDRFRKIFLPPASALQQSLYLRFEQHIPTEIRVVHRLHLPLVALARGMIRGVAQHYGEQVSLTEKKNADGSSELIIRLV